MIGTPKVSLPLPDEVGGLTDISFGWKYAGSAEAVAISEAAANLMSVTTTLNILAVYYENYGCWNNTWPDASTNPPSGYIGAVGGLECNEETWEIEDQNGNISYVEAEVCDYAL